MMNYVLRSLIVAAVVATFEDVISVENQYSGEHRLPTKEDLVDFSSAFARAPGATEEDGMLPVTSIIPLLNCLRHPLGTWERKHRTASTFANILRLTDVHIHKRRSGHYVNYKELLASLLQLCIDDSGMVDIQIATIVQEGAYGDGDMEVSDTDGDSKSSESYECLTSTVAAVENTSESHNAVLWGSSIAAEQDRAGKPEAAFAGQQSTQAHVPVPRISRNNSGGSDDAEADKPATTASNAQGQAKSDTSQHRGSTKRSFQPQPTVAKAIASHIVSSAVRGIISRRHAYRPPNSMQR